MHLRSLSARRLGGALAAVGAAALVSLSSAGIASAASSSSLSPVDQQFLTGNEQTNLTELTLAQLAKQKSTNPQTLALAEKTMSDHTLARQKVTALAQQLGVTLPTAPNATQLAQAAQLKAASGSAFDRLYARVQVAGHQQSIARTQKELSSGTNPQVKAYAQVYLPLAQMHLQMAQAELAKLGGSTAGVPAGSGGGAATDASSPLGWEIGLGAGLATAVGAGVLALRGRRGRPAASGAVQQ